MYRSTPTHGGPVAKFVPLLVAALNSQSENVSGTLVREASGAHAAAVGECPAAPGEPTARASPKLTWWPPLLASIVLRMTLTYLAPDGTVGAMAHPAVPEPFPQMLSTCDAPSPGLASEKDWEVVLIVPGQEPLSAQSLATARAAASAPLWSSRRSWYSAPTSMTSAPKPMMTRRQRTMNSAVTPSSRLAQVTRR